MISLELWERQESKAKFAVKMVWSGAKDVRFCYAITNSEQW